MDKGKKSQSNSTEAKNPKINIYTVKTSIQIKRVIKSQTKLRLSKAGSLSIGVYKPVFLRDKDKSLT